MNWPLSLPLLSSRLLLAYGTQSEFLLPASKASRPHKDQPLQLLPWSPALQPWAISFSCNSRPFLLCSDNSLSSCNCHFKHHLLFSCFHRTLSQTPPCQSELIFTPFSDTWSLYLFPVLNCGFTEDRGHFLFIFGYSEVRTVSAQGASTALCNYLITVGGVLIKVLNQFWDQILKNSISVLWLVEMEMNNLEFSEPLFLSVLSQILSL